MKQKLDKIKKMRLFIIKEIQQLSNEQLNKVPDGFNNNIIWNLAHLVSAMQAICYKRANLTVAISEKYVTPYLTNTKPANILQARDISEIKELLISTVDVLQNDLDRDLFRDYTPSPNIQRQYNITLTSIDDALDFLLYHEGYHTGSILALKRLVSEVEVTR